MRLYNSGIGIFDLLYSSDLDLHPDPMTFIYDLDLYSLAKICRMCESEFLYVKAFITYRQTDRLR